jgi:hypothetical protein
VAEVEKKSGMIDGISQPHRNSETEIVKFWMETVKWSKTMKNHPWDEPNSRAIDDARQSYPKRAVVAKRLIDTKRKAKLLSPSKNTSVQVTPDGVSIVFQSVKQGYTVYWPASAWPELRKWLDSKFEELK